MTVSILRLRELNVQRKKAPEMSEKKVGGRRGAWGWLEDISVSVAQMQVH